jgi:hypothetical protein
MLGVHHVACCDLMHGSTCSYNIYIFHLAGVLMARGVHTTMCPHRIGSRTYSGSDGGYVACESEAQNLERRV